MDRLPMRTGAMHDEKYAALAELFPNAVTEVVGRDGAVARAIDAEALAQEINSRVVEGGEERYQFTWPDKKKAVLLANSPIAAALRPCRGESVDFDNTGNLYIEGDNLDVLKLLRETYLNRIKMIYIDPPYNTGNDFVYADNFFESAGEFLTRDRQHDENGRRMVANFDANGRFHTDWLNMMYPRLRLARDLLRDDGCILISIDDHEQDNLRKICDEIFGPANRMGVLKIFSNPRGRQSSRFFAESGEYLLAYARQAKSAAIAGHAPDAATRAGYNKIDAAGRPYREVGLRKRGSDSRRVDSPTLFYPIFYNERTEEICLEDDGDSLEILPHLEDGTEGRWRWSRQKVLRDKEQLLCRKVKRGGGDVFDVFQKDFYDAHGSVKHKDFWLEKEINYDRGAGEIRALFGEKIFDFTKPLYLLRKLIAACTAGDDAILDFFSGSATTAHAVMRQNADDGGRRRFIMVQIPEICGKDSSAARAGYGNICEIGKERLRRAGKKILAADPPSAATETLDAGFRVLKLDSSNMADVYYTPKETLAEAGKRDGRFESLADNIKPDRSAEDLLFQVMLDVGIPPSAKIEKREIASATIFSVADNRLAACFDSLTEEILATVARSRPGCAVFRDAGFPNDAMLLKLERVFKIHSPDTILKML